jgi:transcriptional regulator with XRE-family HTH domain
MRLGPLWLLKSPKNGTLDYHKSQETGTGIPKMGSLPYHTTITPAQCRGARGMLGWTKDDLAARAKVSVRTIWKFEAGQHQPFERTLREIAAALETAGALFIPPEDGSHRGAVALRWDFEPAKTDATQGAATSQGADKGGLDALDWDWDASKTVEDAEPLPPLDWTDDDRADQIKHWRSRPESWAKLHEVSRQCLLRAMGVERL